MRIERSCQTGFSVSTASAPSVEPGIVRGASLASFIETGRDEGTDTDSGRPSERVHEDEAERIRLDEIESAV
jgi:hypothetical protein